MDTIELSDADLVAESLSGKRDAFALIVERYQTLISSLAYCATGNVGLSEDLAQETFVTAWKKLSELREPAKLRSWLCGIARFHISKEFRRQGREPIHEAESLETLDGWAAPEPLPFNHVISEEEKALLWRHLERIPALYREPLVLFYREHQSIEAVARDLELSEDAVKQRLARGRKLLQEQLLAFVAGALQQTKPGKTFTLGVIAALPLLATSAKASTLGVTASKSASTAKAATAGGIWSVLLSSGAIVLFSLFGVFGFAGRWIGRKMGLASRQSLHGRRCIVQFWRAVAIGFLSLVLPVYLIPNSTVHAHPWLFRAGTWSISVFYCVVAAALLIWLRKRQRYARHPVLNTETTSQFTDKSFNLWVALGMLGPAILVGLFLSAALFTNWKLSSKHIRDAEAMRLIAERDDAQFKVYQYQNGLKLLDIALPENQRIGLLTPFNDSLQSALANKGISYPTLIEDMDFHNGGVRGWLVLLCTFLVVAGSVLLLRRPGKKMFYAQESATPRAERREKRLVAAVAALVMLGLSALFILYTLAHDAPTIATAEASNTILGQKDAAFDVFQFNDGSKELWITPHGIGRYPGFITRADESLLALLVENQITYHTYFQGRDFGYRGPGRLTSFVCSFLLAVGAIMIFGWVIRKKASLARIFHT